MDNIIYCSLCVFSLSFELRFCYYILYWLLYWRVAGELQLLVSTLLFQLHNDCTGSSCPWKFLLPSRTYQGQNSKYTGPNLAYFVLWKAQCDSEPVYTISRPWNRSIDIWYLILCFSFCYMSKYMNKVY